MPVQIRHKVNIKCAGLNKFNPYLAEEIGRALPKVADFLQERVRSKQRIDTGQERRRTVYKISRRGTHGIVSVYNTVVQALVDETGARPHFPPFRKGSKLFNWVRRKGLAQTLGKKTISARASDAGKQARAAGLDKEDRAAVRRTSRARDKDRNTRAIESVSFLIARAISRRGLPRPKDPLRKPFETVRNASRVNVETIVNFAVLKAVKRVNDEAAR